MVRYLTGEISHPGVTRYPTDKRFRTFQYYTQPAYVGRSRSDWHTARRQRGQHRHGYTARRIMCRRIMHSCCMCDQKQECSKMPPLQSPPPPFPSAMLHPPTSSPLQGCPNQPTNQPTNQPHHALSCAWSCARLARARPSRSRPTRCRQSCRSGRFSRRVRRLGGRRRRRPGSNCPAQAGARREVSSSSARRERGAGGGARGG